MLKCFIIMPISTPKPLVQTYRGDVDHFIHVLDHLFVPAIEKAGLDAVRPKVDGAEVIHAKIIKNIEESDLVLCDMSALNPNVFFELGIRTAVDKPACMVVDDITESIPFDTSIVNYHVYNSALDPWRLTDEIQKLSAHIAAARDGGERNPLWRYFSLSTRAEFSEKDTGIEAKVDLISMRLDGLTRQLADQGRAKREHKREADEDPDIRAFNEISEIPRAIGVKIVGGIISSTRIEMELDAEIPDEIKERMISKAKETGRTLTLKSKVE